MFKKILIISAMFFLLNTVHAHSGAHGNDECLISVGNIQLRLNGYQFQGKKPDRHYCRYFPFLGQTIFKIDSISADLRDMSIELQLLQRKSWSDLLFNSEEAFFMIKQLPSQSFSNQVVALESELQTIDFYALKLLLKLADGSIVKKQFIFVAGIPFVHILLGIAVMLLLVVVVVFLNKLRKF